MALTAKVTSKGRVTIPKKVRELLKSDIVEFEIVDETVILKPVKSVGGSLSKYAKQYVPLEEIRDKVWESAAYDREHKTD
jgi:AbrB family looped-hinge helix DNA binding protein